MRLYSYVVTDDTGFSPNPFWGFCTLADCKPAIRRTASIGDWIVGISAKARGNRLIYAMRVDEKVSFAEYFRDRRFAQKIPDYSQASIVHKCGDNIYEPLPNGAFQQLQSMHSNGEHEDADAKAHDLSGRYVLISKQFFYFGKNAPVLPAALNVLKVGRAHKNNFSSETISAFLEFVSDLKPGLNAPPTIWPRSDDSWRQGTQ